MRILCGTILAAAVALVATVVYMCPLTVADDDPREDAIRVDMEAAWDASFAAPDTRLFGLEQSCAPQPRDGMR